MLLVSPSGKRNCVKAAAHSVTAAASAKPVLIKQTEHEAIHLKQPGTYLPVLSATRSSELPDER